MFDTKNTLYMEQLCWPMQRVCQCTTAHASICPLLRENVFPNTTPRTTSLDVTTDEKHTHTHTYTQLYDITTNRLCKTKRRSLAPRQHANQQHNHDKQCPHVVGRIFCTTVFVCTVDGRKIRRSCGNVLKCSLGRRRSGLCAECHSSASRMLYIYVCSVCSIRA